MSYPGLFEGRSKSRGPCLKVKDEFSSADIHSRQIWVPGVLSTCKNELPLEGCVWELKMIQNEGIFEGHKRSTVSLSRMSLSGLLLVRLAGPPSSPSFVTTATHARIFAIAELGNSVRPRNTRSAKTLVLLALGDFASDEHTLRTAQKLQKTLKGSQIHTPWVKSLQVDQK